MAPRGVVPSFDELEAGHAGGGLGSELATVEQLALERGIEAALLREEGFVAEKA